MGKISSKALLAIALGLSLLTALLVYSYLGRQQSHPVLKDTAVIVAKQEILPKAKISADMVHEIKVPGEYLQTGAYQTTDAVIGSIAREHIVPGEQITAQRLLLPGKTGGFTGTIPWDKRAITIAVSEVSGVAGFIKPNDYVDVVVTFEEAMVGDNASQLLLQNILVLATNRETETTASGVEKEAAKDAVKSPTVTLAVTPQEAAQLTLAEDRGKVRLALRPYVPAQAHVVPMPIVPQDLVKVAVRNPAKEVPSSPPPPAAAPNSKAVTPEVISPSMGIQVIRGTKVE